MKRPPPIAFLISTHFLVPTQSLLSYEQELRFILVVLAGKPPSFPPRMKCDLSRRYRIIDAWVRERTETIALNTKSINSSSTFCLPGNVRKNDFSFQWHRRTIGGVEFVKMAGSESVNTFDNSTDFHISID